MSSDRIEKCTSSTPKKTHPDLSVLGLELALGCLIIVDQYEASASSTTKVCPEPERHDTILLGLVHRRELLRELRLGHIRTGRMEDIEDELSPGEQSVRNELAGAEGHSGIGLYSGKQVSASGLLHDVDTAKNSPTTRTIVDGGRGGGRSKNWLGDHVHAWLCLGFNRRLFFCSRLLCWRPPSSLRAGIETLALATI